MLVMQIAVLLFIAVAGTAVVLTRDPTHQVLGLSFYGLLLAVMFFLFQAPDVALSQVAIGAVALPLLFMLALAKIQRNAELRNRDEQRKHSKKVEDAA